MTVSCRVLGHLAHNATESDVCSLLVLGVCVLPLALTHTLASVRTYYTAFVYSVHWFMPEVWTPAARKSQLCSLWQGLFPARSYFISVGRAMNSTSNIDLQWSLGPLLSHVCFLGDNSLSPFQSCQQEPFVWLQQEMAKAAKSKGRTLHVRRSCTISEMISPWLV